MTTNDFEPRFGNAKVARQQIDDCEISLAIAGGLTNGRAKLVLAYFCDRYRSGIRLYGNRNSPRHVRYYTNMAAAKNQPAN